MPRQACTSLKTWCSFIPPRPFGPPPWEGKQLDMIKLGLFKTRVTEAKTSLSQSRARFRFSVFSSPVNSWVKLALRL